MKLAGRHVATAVAVVLAMAGGLYAGQLTVARGAGEPASTQTLSAMRGMLNGQMAKVTVHETGQTPPPIRFAAPDGTEVGLEAFEGEVVLLNLWATWCAPCKRELPTIADLSDALKGEPFRVVAISLDRGKPGKPRFEMKRLTDGRLETFHDPSFQVARDLKAPGLPVTLLIDRSGREVARLYGHADWNTPDGEALVRKLIDG